nr:hypothetical protein [Candidatus Sigynarchaeota archaeon]
MDIDTIIGGCQSIAKEIVRSAFPVGTIYAASRDASIPARLLAMYLQGPRVTFSSQEATSSCNCLVVDDAAYTGNTMRGLARRFKEAGNAFGTACIVMSEDCGYRPSFHAMACSSGVKIVFPWTKNFLETI